MNHRQRIHFMLWQFDNLIINHAQAEGLFFFVLVCLPFWKLGQARQKWHWSLLITWILKAFEYSTRKSMNRGNGSPVSGPSKPGSKATVAEVLRQKSLCTLVICQRWNPHMVGMWNLQPNKCSHMNSYWHLLQLKIQDDEGTFHHSHPFWTTSAAVGLRPFGAEGVVSCRSPSSRSCDHGTQWDHRLGSRAGRMGVRSRELGLQIPPAEGCLSCSVEGFTSLKLQLQAHLESWLRPRKILEDLGQSTLCQGVLISIWAPCSQMSQIGGPWCYIVKKHSTFVW